MYIKNHSQYPKNIPTPTDPSQKSPWAGADKDSVCGDSWAHDIEVRAPYKGVDRFSDQLPRAFGQIEAMSEDLSKSLPILTSEDFSLAVLNAIQVAEQIFDEYKADIDSTNRNVITGLINKAKNYRTKALGLRWFWSEVYSSDIDLNLPWPLDAPHRCGDKRVPETVKIMTMTSQGAKQVTAQCPTHDANDTHEADRVRFFGLMTAAMRNARCAQEAAASVAIHRKNKKYYDSNNIGFSSDGPAGKPARATHPKKAHLKDGLFDGDASPLPERAPRPDATEEVPETKKAPKKKDNTGLILGLGVGALLLFSRKK